MFSERKRFEQSWRQGLRESRVGHVIACRLSERSAFEDVLVQMHNHRDITQIQLGKPSIRY